MRGRAGHWSYDLNRHLALVEALKAERGALRHLMRSPPSSVLAVTTLPACGVNEKTAPERDGFS